MTRTKRFGHHGLGRLEQPFQGCPVVACRWIHVWIQVAFHVIDCASQDEDLISQCIELTTGHDQFVFVELQFVGTLPGDPVPLATCL